MGRTGNPPRTKVTAMMISETVNTRTRKRFSTLCRPRRMRCPSRNAAGTAANESFSRMISAAARVACAPLCMAIPRFAFLMESTSFTPSPVMAT